ncbi:MAG: hypothetical protein E6K49_04280 [Gammaproteobacteria bacterium]|nr:MAG: hypothetical protein E6K52_08700 [Gammaproteobacteria bacterium]TLY79161.1 MAG: hypothetical protein E6K49_04280 [Gammaproteobacteria bacterium]
MKLTAEHQARLEQLIDRACREQPALAAPPTLHTRVFAALQQRAALPWWRRSFAYWPMAPRVVFVLACSGLARAMLEVTVWFNTNLGAVQLPAPVSRSLSWVQSARALVSLLGSTAGDVGATLLHRIPPLWLYGGIVGVLALYALLVGVGAAAYRTLYGPSLTRITGRSR